MQVVCAFAAWSARRQSVPMQTLSALPSCLQIAGRVLERMRNCVAFVCPHAQLIHSTSPATISLESVRMFVEPRVRRPDDTLKVMEVRARTRRATGGGGGCCCTRRTVDGRNALRCCSVASARPSVDPRPALCVCGFCRLRRAPVSRS